MSFWQPATPLRMLASLAKSRAGRSVERPRSGLRMASWRPRIPTPHGTGPRRKETVRGDAGRGRTPLARRIAYGVPRFPWLPYQDELRLGTAPH